MQGKKFNNGNIPKENMLKKIDKLFDIDLAINSRLNEIPDTAENTKK